MSLMINGVPNFPKPTNASLVQFSPGSPERKLLEEEIRRLRNSKPIYLPLLIDGQPIRRVIETKCVVPHDHSRILGMYAMARPEDVIWAIDTALKARKTWQQLPWYIRLNIFRKAACLLQTKYYYRLIAATMEDYSKNPFEAMIDVNELIDFWAFNAYFASQIYHEQPESNPSNFNFVDYAPLEGFVAAFPPNNFISIAGNLPTAPIMMGCVSVCKPASDTVFSFHIVMEVLHEAGLPPDVLNIIHGDSKMIGEIILNHPELAGVHFTGSTDTFNYIWRTIGQNIEKYRSYPRIVGETGGKDFMVIYDDADPVTTAVAMVASGFGYQGRKCSALSRVYVSEKMWPKLKPILEELMQQIKIGDVANFRNFLGAIISEAEYRKIVGYIKGAIEDSNQEVFGDNWTDKKGWFISPTLIVTDNPHYETMEKEIFGPVITVCVLDGKKYKQVLKLADKTSPYGLTGAVRTEDIYKLSEALQALRYTAGNIYDWKTTGAVVNQQPFGGGRRSGTDDKAGSKTNLYRWTQQRTISLTNGCPTHFAPGYLER